MHPASDAEEMYTPRNTRSTLNLLEQDQCPHGKGPYVSPDQIQGYLQASAVVLTDPTGIIPLEDHTRENKWADHPIWANYATRLDESPLAYFLPTHFEALRILTAVAPPYAEAWTQSGSLCLYFVGTVPEDRPFGPFWDPQCEEHYISKKAQFPSDAYRFFTFGRAVQQDLDTQDRDDQWKRAYNWSKEYTATHRK